MCCVQWQARQRATCVPAPNAAMISPGMYQCVCSPGHLFNVHVPLREFASLFFLHDIHLFLRHLMVFSLVTLSTVLLTLTVLVWSVTILVCHMYRLRLPVTVFVSHALMSTAHCCFQCVRLPLSAFACQSMFSVARNLLPCFNDVRLKTTDKD